jgi:ABC-type branched-subunit amino acid transport system substrate-binding protein
VAAPLTIGVAVPDLSEYSTIDAGWGVGDPREQVEAAVEAARSRGRLPVHGRDLRLVFRAYEPNRVEGKSDAARHLVEDDQAFAVIGGRDFTEGALVLAVLISWDLVMLLVEGLELAGPDPARPHWSPGWSGSNRDPPPAAPR